jgi:hypothetical protein
MSILEGWVEKQSNWLKEWRRRYFWMYESYLVFAHDDHEQSSTRLVVDLLKLKELVDRKAERVLKLRVKNKKTISLRMESVEVWEKWYSILERCKENPPVRVTMADLHESKTCIVDEYNLMYILDGFGTSKTKIDVQDMTQFQKITLRHKEHKGLIFTIQQSSTHQQYTIFVVHESAGEILNYTAITSDQVYRDAPVISPPGKIHVPRLVAARGYQPLKQVTLSPNSSFSNTDTPLDIFILRSHMNNHQVVTCNDPLITKKVCVQLWNLEDGTCVQTISFSHYGKLLDMLSLNAFTIILLFDVSQTSNQSNAYLVKLDLSAPQSTDPSTHLTTFPPNILQTGKLSRLNDIFFTILGTKNGTFGGALQLFKGDTMTHIVEFNQDNVLSQALIPSPLADRPCLVLGSRNICWWDVVGGSIVMQKTLHNPKSPRQEGFAIQHLISTLNFTMACDERNVVHVLDNVQAEVVCTMTLSGTFSRIFAYNDDYLFTMNESEVHVWDIEKEKKVQTLTLSLATPRMNQIVILEDKRITMVKRQAELGGELVIFG